MNFKKNHLRNIDYNRNEIINKYKKVHNSFLNVDTYCKYISTRSQFSLGIESLCLTSQTNPFTL